MHVRSTQIDADRGWRRPGAHRAERAFFAGCLLAAGAGCASPPPAVTTNLTLTDGEAREKTVLTDADRAEIRRAFSDLAAGHRPVNPPAPAEGGIDWNDAVPAARSAVGEVEATVVSVESAPDGSSHRFLIRTVEDYPGEVVIRRVDGPSVYAAEAWIGRFPNEPRHAERAQKLVEEIDKELRRLGEQRWFREERHEGT